MLYEDIKCLVPQESATSSMPRLCICWQHEQLLTQTPLQILLIFGKLTLNIFLEVQLTGTAPAVGLATTPNLTEIRWDDNKLTGAIPLGLAEYAPSALSICWSDPDQLPIAGTSALRPAGCCWCVVGAHSQIS